MVNANKTNTIYMLIGLRYNMLLKSFDITDNMTSRSITELLLEFEKHLTSVTYYHLGYPYNLDHDYDELKQLFQYSINNLGDPFIESNYGIHSRVFEKAVLNWFANLWNISEYWGYMTSCGTEGNLYGILLGREVLKSNDPESKTYLLASEESHYSVWKAALMYNLTYYRIPCLANGQVCVESYEDQICNVLKVDSNAQFIIVVNIGTTLKGAIDNLFDISKIMSHNISNRKRYFVHLDGALSGIILPLIDNHNPLDFSNTLIDSISVSGHKFLGSPIPCGIVITKNAHSEVFSKDIEYIGSKDTTILGSRNGHAPLFMWYTICKKGRIGIENDIKDCITLAKYMRDKLVEHNIKDVLLNEYGSTVVFQKPASTSFIMKWQLACKGNLCHVVVMPNVKKDKIDEFIHELTSYPLELV